MEILENKFKLGKTYFGQATNEENAKQDIVEKLIGFMALTEEDRLRAGIYIGNEGRDWIDRSALILPSSFIME